MLKTLKPRNLQARSPLCQSDRLSIQLKRDCLGGLRQCFVGIKGYEQHRDKSIESLV
ncbi:hypothetical protein H6F93_13990 [Leptolyngbya sp. FACHB-671]|uniref:hypothetical protein n=1 Tax=Leptolyngbya sp. FACHB-671 TaxID=2692812 RepID=UPI0019C826C2|nr:hypothetical protein [Leptolyngbya sp. FACHB-671]MBD2068621.1 hypothetical protein [Leptolyngbya sp. FACHB-671]